jgi:UDP-N-acetylglucosamine acyltransferase
MAIEIHKTAIVSKKADIGDDVVIGPYCIIEAGVKIGSGSQLLSHVVIEGDTEIGEGCMIHQFATIGLPPQDLKYKNEKTAVKIGRKNIIREYVSIHRASISGSGVTRIGDSNFIMAYVHIAHDCVIGQSNILANACTFAGHVMIEDFVFIGGLVAIHQNNRIGAYAMVGGCTGITQDIPPYTMASDHRAKLYGLNIIGLKRRGFSDETINTLKKAYKILFRDKATMSEALERIRNDLPQIPEIKHLVEFIEANKRGICR